MPEKITAFVDYVQAIALSVGNLLLPIGGALVVIALIWGGIQYLQGNAEAGKKTIIAALVGLAIIAFGSVIANLANDALTGNLIDKTTK